MAPKPENVASITDAKTGEYRELPYNIEAEQILLGAILIDNEQLHKVEDFLLAEHFFEPAHQCIYTHIQKLMARGLLANPVTLKGVLDKEEVLKDLGGASYLAKLSGLAAGIVYVKDYGQTVYDLALNRGLIRVGQDIVEDVYSEKELSASEQIEQAEHQLFMLASDGSSDRHFTPVKTSLTEAINRAEFALKQQGEISGVPTGFTDLDRLLGGLHDSDLVILAGRPSMGKTALAVNVALNAAQILKERYEKADETSAEPMQSVGIFSLEMSAEQIAARLLSMETGISSNDIRRGRLDESKGEFEKLVQGNRALYELPIFIDDTPALTISAVRSRARRLKRKHNLGLLVIDYLQLLRGVGGASRDSRVQEVSEITQGLKAIAKELNVPIIALSQLSRAVEQRDDKRPQLSDLRESGSIEQDSDIVMFIYREQYYLERTRPADGTDELEAWMEKNGERWMHTRNKAEIIVSKHRSGPIGNVHLLFESATTQFKDLAQDEYSSKAPFNSDDPPFAV